MDKNIKFPKHDFGLILEHNPHKRFQQTIKEYVEGNCFDFSSEEDKLKCIEIDDLWVLQWYPENSVGFFCVAASGFEKVLSFSLE